MKRVILFCTLLASVSAGVRGDTLDFRNGITLTGKFVSIDEAQVSFMIDGEVKSYARSQISKITFSTDKITVGQSIDQVTTLVGQPKRIVEVGSKKIYIYSDFKITFVDGKVTAID